MTYQLTFTMDLGISQELILGNLRLVYPDGTPIDYLATSGLPDYQRPGDQWARGKGPIPAGEYEVPTEPYWLDTRGVEGYFFHISPDPVSSDGRTRSELGIHWDANVPGTSGCLGITRREAFLKFCERMAKIRALGIDFIPLEVEY
jgi:hypothetical protein